MFHRTVIAHTGASHISFTKTLLVTDLLGFVFCFALLTQSYVSIGRGTLYSQTKVGTLCQSFTTLPCVSKLFRTSRSNLWIIANDRNDCFEMAIEEQGGKKQRHRLHKADLMSKEIKGIKKRNKDIKFFIPFETNPPWPKTKV